MSNEIRYSRWHTPRVCAANALDILGSAVDLVLGGSALYLAVLATFATVGQAPGYGSQDVLGLGFLALVCLGAGRAVLGLMSAPAEWLRPGWGHFPAWAVPARIREQVAEFLTAVGTARVNEVALGLNLPRSTARSALHQLTAAGDVVKSRRGLWGTAQYVATGREPAADGPQVPVVGGDAQ